MRLVSTVSSSLLVLGMFGAHAAPAAGPENLLSPPAQERSISSAGALVHTQFMQRAQVVFIDLDTEERIVDFGLKDALPDLCRSRTGQEQCLVIGGQHVVHDDRDYVVLAATHIPDLATTVAKVSVTAPYQPVWTLNQIDFSNTQSNGSCTRTCGDPGPVPKACKPGEIHEVYLVEENTEEQWAEVIMADILGSRVEQVRLDYRNGNSCGEVQWVLDTSNPEWPDTNPLPNGLQLLDEPEGNFLIVSLHTQDSRNVGSGRVLLWDLDVQPPSLLWSFPQGSAADMPYLNTMHHGLIQTDPISGARFLTVGHSLAESAALGTGTGGSFTIAEVKDIRKVPDYMGEWVLPPAYDNLDFTREMEILPDGQFFGVDAGCYLVPFPGMPCPAQLYWFEPSSLPSSDLTGQWARNHQQQNFVELTEAEVKRELKCGLHMLFEADVIPRTALGRDLREAQAAGGTACESYGF